MPSCCFIFESPGNAVKEIFIFMDHIRPPLRPAAGAKLHAASALPVSLPVPSPPCPRLIRGRLAAKRINLLEG
jgi:hypothetical protein